MDLSKWSTVSWQEQVQVLHIYHQFLPPLSQEPILLLFYFDLFIDAYSSLCTEHYEDALASRCVLKVLFIIINTSSTVPSFRMHSIGCVRDNRGWTSRSGSVTLTSKVGSRLWAYTGYKQGVSSSRKNSHLQRNKSFIMELPLARRWNHHFWFSTEKQRAQQEVTGNPTASQSVNRVIYLFIYWRPIAQSTTQGHLRACRRGRGI